VTLSFFRSSTVLALCSLFSPRSPQCLIVSEPWSMSLGVYSTLCAIQVQFPAESWKIAQVCAVELLRKPGRSLCSRVILLLLCYPCHPLHMSVRSGMSAEPWICGDHQATGLKDSTCASSFKTLYTFAAPFCGRKRMAPGMAIGG
jgi:hypothetical protein